jgi:CDP-diacylglycerol--serine O-phosphatidyltransferase
MRKIQNQAVKEKLLNHMRKERLKYIAILPSLITLLNGMCGFAAIVFANKGAFAWSGYMLMLAMIADMLDGRVARMSKSTSSFGGQLDSLCDMLSFGMFNILEHKLQLVELAFLERFIWLAAAIYISCAAIRLARFNVENEEDESAHMSFIGLPTPAAAGVIASLVLFHQETLPEFITKSFQGYIIIENAIIYTLPFLALGTAVLMVSRIRYPHIVNQYIKGKKPFAHLIRLLLLIGLVIWSVQTALAVIFCGFAASGFVKWSYYRLMHRKEELSLEPAMKNV